LDEAAVAWDGKFDAGGGGRPLCKLVRGERHLEYPFQSKTLATRGASEWKVVDLSCAAKGR